MSVVRMPWEESGQDASSPELTNAQYFGAYDSYMTSHKLEDIRRSPAFFHAKHIARTQPQEEQRSEYVIGRATHTLVLEGWQKFTDSYHVSDGPINPKTEKPYGKDTLKYSEWLKTLPKGQEVITVTDLAIMKKMAESVKAHEESQKHLTAGRSEVTIRSLLCGVKCQSRLDWVEEESRKVVDLKTTKDIDRFEKDFFWYGYDRQMAFYRLMINALAGCAFDLYVIAVEKEFPFRCGCWNVSPTTLSAAEQEVISKLGEYRYCSTHNVWPTKYEELRVL